MKVAEALERDVKEVVQKTGFDVFRGVVTRTPVDTGWARSSWNIAFTTMDTSVPPKTEGGLGTAKAVNSKQEKKLELYPDDFPVIWITNGLPYIVPLENGHSKQMDKGYMVQRTMAQVIANINASLRELGK